MKEKREPLAFNDSCKFPEWYVEFRDRNLSGPDTCGKRPHSLTQLFDCEGIVEFLLAIPQIDRSP